MTTTTKRDVYAEITTKIVEQLEKGVRPWCKPWNAAHAAGHVNRPLRAGGEKYRGINVLALWMSAEFHGYACPIWISFKQALDLGGAVRKGEKGTLVVYANRFTVKDQDENGDDVEREIPFLKGYTVFSV
jgi:antirestriction protein ArdC